MNDVDLTLQTGIALNVAHHAKLLKEIVEAPADKGMSVSIGELKQLQKTILKDVKMLNRHILKEEFLARQERLEGHGGIWHK